ncbi:bifunctional folylpolyglutamate synthase/dihydrofolate synthase [Liquorilactobacillus satsumensis]|uniref:tetrahydrofolate synthase n=2 Tax=Liquorilactobacillus satsumensis TaxID=259059 RepID=A0A0R1V0V1_9LACO|nr:Mur ligase family protein [Liquorilactobacillus satsumensis]AJA34279.1 bifunctional folylpolyglutamate synthase dihydrofolate synthase [Liquorilactobacillus satsumensis]KRL99126.1 bifunctional folylpolyglutamate synthase dihydrofolate synthase [Liquorilactobacillus satsumensis DSM 16230 = JCM 12392]
MANDTTKKLPSFLYGQGDRIALLKRVLHQLGHPDEKFKIIHVCGTNGKGSTSTMIAALLQKMGERTGLFTSPFIDEVTESIRIDDTMISAASFAGYVKVITAVLVKMELDPAALSAFEMTFVVAMLYFAEHRVAYVVLECGLGGELDATNAVKTTAYSIFTKIGLDHTRILGTTIAEIAVTKSKIIRAHAEVIIAPKQPPQVYTILAQQARRMAAQVHLAATVELRVVATAQTKTFMQLKTAHAECTFEYSLLGTYQQENLATVLRWLQVFLAKEKRNFKLEQLIAKTMPSLSIPGRFEKIKTAPLIILDAAHNLDGIKAFTATVNTLYPEKPKKIVVGFLKDKDYGHCVAKLLEIKNASFYLTEPEHPTRKLAAVELQQVFDKISRMHAPAFTAARQAFNQAVAAAKEEDGLILVVGSFYLLKAVRKLIVPKNKEG